MVRERGKICVEGGKGMGRNSEWKEVMEWWKFRVEGGVGMGANMCGWR